MLINVGWTLEEGDKYLILIYVRSSFHEGSKLELMIASSKNRYLYNPALKERARTLRKNGTLGEAIMWKYVLKSRMTGFQFSRQRPVLNYIADFMCKELLLIIEVDGASHDDPVSDAARQIEL